LGEFFSLVLRLSKTVLRRSDYKRWANPDSCLKWWGSRTARIAQLIPAGSRVIEFGAGNRQLETLLPSRCTYVPADLVDRGPGTVVCDLNQRPLPDLAYLMAHLAVFVGVFEYLNDLPSVVQWLSGQFVICVASYHAMPSRRRSLEWIRELFKRACNGYLSYYTEAQLIGLFEENGFICSKTETWKDQKLFLFIKSKVGSSAPSHNLQG
jgi:hypothetical protein